MTKKVKLKELEQQCLEAEKAFKALQEQLQQAKKEEEEAKQAKLQAEREARYNEVINVYKQFEELRSKYVDDYGYFTFETTKSGSDDSFDWFWKTIGMY